MLVMGSQTAILRQLHVVDLPTELAGLGRSDDSSVIEVLRGHLKKR